jgi:predicted nucleic acid-binding protein
MRKVSVSDTSVLLNLAFIDRLDILNDCFDQVFVPDQVWEELMEGEKGREKLREFESSLELVEVEEVSFFFELRNSLDVGESACIKYAVRNDVELVLLDESEGRRKAKHHGLKVTGVIGLLMKAGLDMKQEMDELKDSGFYISDELYSKVLEESKN